MSPFSFLSHSICPANPRVLDFFDFRGVLHIGLALRSSRRGQPACEIRDPRVQTATAGGYLRRGKVIYAAEPYCDPTRVVDEF